MYYKFFVNYNFLKYSHYFLLYIIMYLPNTKINKAQTHFI